MPNLRPAQTDVAGSASPPLHVLVFVPHTIGVAGGSGVQRVTRQIVEALTTLGTVDLVKWDSIDGQLRYLSAGDCQRFFHSLDWSRRYQTNRFAGRRRYRFADTIPTDQAAVWLLLPEIFYHLSNGVSIYRNVLAQARAYGWRTAGIFYDLIPITNLDYAEELGANHATYMRELLKLDLVMPISRFSGDELCAFEARQFGIDNVTLRQMRRRVVPVPLAGTCEWKIGTAGARAIEQRDLILLVGTVEPRKQQIEVLHAFQIRDLARRYGLKIAVVGALHPKCAARMRDLSADPAIDYVGYADDDQFSELYARARFSVFASCDEGFGLPIIESLARGVPCLTADFGAMREAGEGGGCLFVNVRDQAALASGLERMAGDAGLIAKLCAEIESRTFRTWIDYGRDLIAAFHAYDASVDEWRLTDWTRDRISDFRSSQAPSALWCRPEKRSEPSWLLGCTSTFSDTAFRAVEDAFLAGPAARRMLFVASSAASGADLTGSAANAVFGADVWLFEDRSTYEHLVALARYNDYAGLLPTRCIILSDEPEDRLQLASLNAYMLDCAKRQSNAARERAFTQASRLATSAPLSLSIVISTYNRGPFVAENVRWLMSFVPKYEGAVRVVVVDNASTDDTANRLAPYRGMQYLDIIRNPVNVGMLGNLQVCSTLNRSDYTWVIGDDDFIIPEAFDHALAVLLEQSAIPFVFLNFGVYHRTALEACDSAETLIQHPTVLASHPSPSGIYTVRAIAGEHDNLFTAIYPIVFRTDLLSACFNYTFTGTPFGSLVESIPTTKLILEEYGDADAFWISDIGIVGNAHNSWQRYRVPWHGVIMPLAFELAREAGVNSVKLHDWAEIHRRLYADAQQLFPDEAVASRFNRLELDASFRVFRDRLLSFSYSAQADKSSH